LQGVPLGTNALAETVATLSVCTALAQVLVVEGRQPNLAKTSNGLKLTQRAGFRRPQFFPTPGQRFVVSP
jgi:hypothetical protein